MELALSSEEPLKIKTDLLVMTVFEDDKTLSGDVKKMDQLLKSKLTLAMKDLEFVAKKKSFIVFDAPQDLSIKRVGFVGLGKKKDFDGATTLGYGKRNRRKSQMPYVWKNQVYHQTRRALVLLPLL